MILNEELNEGEYGLMYSLDVYEYGTLKPAEVIVRRGRGRGRRVEGMNETREHCMHTWKHHNENPCTTMIY
jgi:hypothetical protein